jgi:hypothetical protein
MTTHVIIKIELEGEPQRFLEAWRRGELARVQAGQFGTQTVLEAIDNPNEGWILGQWNGSQENVAPAVEAAVRAAAGESGVKVASTSVHCLVLKEVHELEEELVGGEGI